MDIVNKIIELQKQQGLSNNALAQRAGLSQSTVQSTVKRGIVPTIITLQKLCSALGITLEEFFSEDEKQVDPNESRLLAAYRSLPEDQQKTVVTMVDALAKE